MNFQEGSTGEGAENTKNYIRLKDKDTVKGVFRGEPEVMHKHWNGNQPTLCEGPSCSLCAEGDKRRFSFKINILVREGEQYVAKIFEQGWKTYNQLKDLNAEFPLERTVVSVSRRGSGLNDTSYAILPINGGAVTADLDAKLSKIELFDLKPKHEFKAGAITQNPPESHRSIPPMDDDLPF